MELLNGLSIMPSLYCNYNCEYCYLGDLRKNKTLLNLDILANRLDEITQNYTIQHTTLYGGEISLLPQTYLNDLLQLVKDYNPAFVTNLSQEWFLNYCLINNVKLSISLNEERTNYNKTLQILKTLKGIKSICLSVVVLPSLLKKDSFEILDFFEDLGFDVIFIQYHPSIHSKVVYNITTKDYSDFLLRIIKAKYERDYKFKIQNEIVLRDTTYRATADSFMFINQNGNFSSIKYNEKEEEYFVEFNTLQEWKDFCKQEQKLYYTKCHTCKYYNKCKAEHLVNLEKDNCSGLYNLLEEYSKIG